MSIYDIISSGDFEQDLKNMFDLLVYFRVITSSKKNYLEHVKECGTKYDDEELYVSPKYSLEELQSIMQKEISAIDELAGTISDHLDLFHDWD